MKVRLLITRAAFLMLALVIFSEGALLSHRYAAASERVTPLRFGQAIALSDFDADGLIDEARIEESSQRRSVGILLSSTGKRSFLHFNSSPAYYGSLLAQDVDNDGDTDLIWTDLLRADDVIVWLGDGTGQFERSSEKGYSDRFTLGSSSVDGPCPCDHETGINPFPNRPLDLSLAQNSVVHLPSRLQCRRFEGSVVISPTLSRPAGRSPPVSLS